MANQEITSKGGELLTTEEWMNQHQRVRTWMESIVFHRFELRFFKDILDKFFIQLINDEMLDDLSSMSVKLTDLENQCISLEARCSKIDEDIATHLEKPQQLSEEALLDEYMEIQKGVSGFESDFRQLKRAVFTITEHMLRTEKLKHLLTP